MTRDSGTPRANDAEWKVESLRLTVFYPQGAVPNTEGLWNQVTGTDPESVVNRPKMGDRAEVGRYRDYPLAMQVLSRDARIDWVMGGSFGAFDDPECMPARMDLFLAIMRPWLSASTTPLSRLAFGAISMLRTGGWERAHDTLSNYLNFDVDEEMSDFLYQVNRKRRSRVMSDIMINRLMKWSIAANYKGMVRLSSEGPSSVQPEPPEFWVRVELDINTPPEQETGLQLRQEALTDILDEMSLMVLEIVRQGDVP
jgi:hypothetical protein